MSDLWTRKRFPRFKEGEVVATAAMQPLTPWEAREILGHGPGTGWPGYLTHHPDCSPPKDCMCMLFAIQNRLRAIAESDPRSPSSPAPSSEQKTSREIDKIARIAEPVLLVIALGFLVYMGWMTR